MATLEIDPAPPTGWYGVMIRFDEWLCKRLHRPVTYLNLTGEDGARIAAVLNHLAYGDARAYYDDGRPVPRSLFHSRAAVLLMGEHPRQRRKVITPYGWCSGREIVLGKDATKGPWGLERYAAPGAALNR